MASNTSEIVSLAFCIRVRVSASIFLCLVITGRPHHAAWLGIFLTIKNKLLVFAFLFLSRLHSLHRPLSRSHQGGIDAASEECRKFSNQRLELRGIGGVTSEERRYLQSSYPFEEHLPLTLAFGLTARRMVIERLSASGPNSRASVSVHPSGSPMPLDWPSTRPETSAPYLSFLASISATRTMSLSGYWAYFVHENESGYSSQHLRATSSVCTRPVAPPAKYKQ